MSRSNNNKLYVFMFVILLVIIVITLMVAGNASQLYQEDPQDSSSVITNEKQTIKKEKNQPLQERKLPKIEPEYDIIDTDPYGTGLLDS